VTAAEIDLDACAREPIHVPGAIQPHGVLVALLDGKVVALSDNAERFLGRPVAVGAPALEALGEALTEEIRDWSASAETTLLREATVGGRSFVVSAHRSQALAVVELESAPETDRETLEALYPRVRTFVERLQELRSLDDLCREAAAQVRALTGFDRVLVYRFDADGHGTVLGEDRNDRLPGYLGHRFPASDIPAQARALYKLNRLRIIPDADYRPVAVRPASNPMTGSPIDLSLSVLRSVSPVHLEYMRNMGTPASMSVSIMVDGELWGLISCHHAEPRRVSPQVRASCDFLAQIVSLQIGSLGRMFLAARRVELQGVQRTLLTAMAGAHVFTDALVQNPSLWLGLADAEGAAVVSGETLLAAGRAPPPEEIRRLVSWLDTRRAPELFVTDRLGQVMPDARGLIGSASGVLAVPISEITSSYILWFRPEVVKTITWAGDPSKPVDPETPGRLHPRRSFEAWSEQVRGRAEPWGEAELQTVREMRDAVVAVVLRQAEERAQLTEELQRTNRELEAFSYSISHDLRAPFRHIVGYAQLLADRSDGLDAKSHHYIDSIKESALAAGRLVDDLLAFSQLSRSSLTTGRVDMNKLVAEVRKSLTPELEGRVVAFQVGRLASTWGDASMLRQVWMNLVGNAVKYTRDREPALIEISSETTPDEIVYRVRDNGVGFEMAYVGKLFGVFQRLHRAEEFEGTGIGLAIAQRIVNRHGGRIWAEGEKGVGAVFSFALPRTGLEGA
jgi:light-regulated signal transduction histidine kinase (bacteriophytochrome)